MAYVIAEPCIGVKDSVPDKWQHFIQKNTEFYKK